MKFPNARVTLVSGLGLGGGCMACCTSCSPGGSSDLNNGYPSSQSGTFTNFTMSSVLICWHAYFQSSYCWIVASVRALSAAFTMMLWLQIKKKQWFCCPSESKCSKYVEEQYTDSTIDKIQACRGRSINVNTIVNMRTPACHRLRNVIKSWSSCKNAPETTTCNHDHRNASFVSDSNKCGSTRLKDWKENGQNRNCKKLKHCMCPLPNTKAKKRLAWITD